MPVVINNMHLVQSQTSPSDKFAELDDLLPTPNEQRTASGGPGHGYRAVSAPITRLESNSMTSNNV